jgi:hypothetical protein
VRVPVAVAWAWASVDAPRMAMHTIPAQARRARHETHMIGEHMLDIYW